mgnify:CR=1 FL=1
MRNRLLAFLLPAVTGAVMAVAATAAAHEYKLGDIVIHHPWARASAGNAKTAAAYFGLVNTGAEPDRLIAAEATVGRAELHTHIHEEDVVKMRQVEAIDLAAGETVTLEPGGLHVMLMDLVEPLKEGNSFPLTLTFERAGSIEVEVKIEGVASMHGEHGASGTH